MNIARYQTSKDQPFSRVENRASKSGSPDTHLYLTGKPDQEIRGFGGSFNELGWVAMKALDDKKRETLMDQLFATGEDGTGLNFCRIPIGASDFATGWYSHNEHEYDYGMEHFSIERDRKNLLPFITSALKRQPEMRLFASPWSPPTWMKHPAVYNYGTLIWTEQNLRAYALYLARFIEEYRDVGIAIDQLHVQNEPVISQKFPSCRWTGDELAEFIGSYLGPMLRSRGIDSDIWLGTLNGPSPDFFDENLVTGYHDYANLVLHDETARQYITGVGYQWGGKYAIQQTRLAWPELRLMQTENECGDGKNTWEYARYIFGLFHHYFLNGAEAYIYWNMVLAEGGESSWGWRQNSLVSINTETGDFILNPEFYLMKHFSAFINDGDRREDLSGPFSANALAFRKKNRDLVLVAYNPFNRDMTLEIQSDVEKYMVSLAGDSINTVLIKE